MPKFESKLVEAEKDLGNGRVRPGKVALIPLDDAAMVSKHAEASLAAGIWKPASGNAIKEAAKRLAEAEKREDIRLGRRPPENS